MCSILADADDAHARFSAARGELIERVIALASSETWKGNGARDLSSFLAARWQISGQTARELVREAAAIRERPALGEALSEGALSVDQCRALETLCDEGCEEVWLENLRFYSICELEREARKKRAREAERRDDGVFFRTQHTRDERYLRGEFQLHPEDGAVVINAIDALVPEGVKLRDYDHAAARAFVALASGEKPDPAVVVVSIEDDMAAVSSSGFVSTETAKRMACDSRIQIGERTSRTIPPNLRRAVEVRDRGMCVFPGCESKIYLECHHVVPVAEKGPTVLSNLVLLCWNHHNLVHEHHWSLAGEAGPNIKWIRPNGTIFEPRVRVTLDTS